MLCTETTRAEIGPWREPLYIDKPRARSLSQLSQAIQNNRVDVVREILDHRARTDRKNDASCSSALFHAVRCHNIDVVRLLIEQGTDLNRSATDDRRMETPLGTAVRLGHTDIVELLLSHGADPNIIDYKGHTPLIIASAMGLLEEAKLLVNHGAFLNSCDRLAMTPLHYAVQNLGSSDNWTMLSLLLNHGADPNVSNLRNDLPLDIALDLQDEHAIQMLLEAGSPHLSALVFVGDVYTLPDPNLREHIMDSPCYKIVIRYLKLHGNFSLRTYASRHCRRLLIEFGGRKATSIFPAIDAFPMPVYLKDDLKDFVGPFRRLRV